MILARRLSAAQREQRNFRRHAEPHWSADGAESAVHINRGVRAVQSCGVQEFLRGDGLGRSEQRPHVETGDVVGDEARGTQAVVENFDLNLAAVSVAGE